MRVSSKVRQHTCSDIFAEVACDKFLAVKIVIDESLQALHPYVILIISGRNPNCIPDSDKCSEHRLYIDLPEELDVLGFVYQRTKNREQPRIMRRRPSCCSCRTVNRTKS